RRHRDADGCRHRGVGLRPRLFLPPRGGDVRRRRRAGPAAAGRDGAGGGHGVRGGRHARRRRGRARGRAGRGQLARGHHRGGDQAPRGRWVPLGGRGRGGGGGVEVGAVGGCVDTGRRRGRRVRRRGGRGGGRGRAGAGCSVRGLGGARGGA